MKSMIKSNKTVLNKYWMLFLFLIMVSFIMRLPTFYIGHTRGDQLDYTALAMKLDNVGFGGYNLRRVAVFDRKSVPYSLVAYIPSSSKKNAFYYLNRLPGYYDSTLFHKPPLLSYFIMLSHRMAGANKEYYYIANNDATDQLRSFHPRYILNDQIYLAVVPFLFSLLFIAATVWCGKFLFSFRVGLLAGLLLSVTPIELLSAQRIWTEDMCSFFIVMSLVFYLAARQNEKFLPALVAGVLAGLATLTKPSGNILFLIVLLHELCTKFKGKRTLIPFFIGGIVVSFPWHWQVWKHYGTLLHMPLVNYKDVMNNMWFRFVYSRPWYMFIVNTVVQMPLYIFSLFGCVKLWRIAVTKKEAITSSPFTFLLVWVFVFSGTFAMAWGARELRHMLPVFPALSILSAAAIDAIWVKVSGKKANLWATITVLAVVLLVCGWSGYVGLANVLGGKTCIIMPY